MACSCHSGDKKATVKKCVVLDKSGTKVKTYSNNIEAKAHAARIGGKTSCS